MLSNIDFGSYFHTKKYEKGLSTGGDKIADWGGSKGGWGGHVPPSLYVKRGPVLTSLMMPSSLLQVVHRLFQTCYNDWEQAVSNTTCRALVNRFVTTCLQTCHNLCVLTCVLENRGGQCHVLKWGTFHVFCGHHCCHNWDRGLSEFSYLKHCEVNEAIPYVY